MPSQAPTEAAAGCAAGTPSTRGTLTTAVIPVTVHRGSGAARMPFLAAMDVPLPAEHGKRGVGKGMCKLAPTAKRAQSSLDTNFPAFASAMANLTAQGTVDGAPLGSSHYTAAMSMVFTHGLEMPETGGRPCKRDAKMAKAAGHLNVHMITSGSVHVSRTNQVRVLEKCIGGLKQKMLDHPSPTKPAPVPHLPSATLLSPCVKRVYDSPSAVLESALTRKRGRSRIASMGNPSTASVADSLVQSSGCSREYRANRVLCMSQLCCTVCVLPATDWCPSRCRACFNGLS